MTYVLYVALGAFAGFACFVSFVIGVAWERARAAGPGAVRPLDQADADA